MDEFRQRVKQGYLTRQQIQQHFLWREKQPKEARMHIILNKSSLLAINFFSFFSYLMEKLATLFGLSLVNFYIVVVCKGSIVPTSLCLICREYKCEQILYVIGMAVTSHLKHSTPDLYMSFWVVSNVEVSKFGSILWSLIHGCYSY